MANPQMYLHLAKSFFQRNNPVEALVMNVIQSVYNLVTLHSRMKLLKYRFMLETQKLSRIEQTLNEFDPLEDQGSKMDRTY